MQANHVPFGVTNDGNKAILAYCKLFPENLTTVFFGSRCLNGTIITGEID